MSGRKRYDLVVVGGGPGGYVAAIRAGQLGMTVACVERERVGGICSNWGCIPTKALLRSAEVLELVRHAGEYGVIVEGQVSVDFGRMMERSRRIVDMQERGVLSLFKKNKVELVTGTARLAGPGRVAVNGDTLEAGSILLATGARAKSLPGVEIDGERVIEYRGALGLERPPRSAIVIGAGAIGVEFASFHHALGVPVTIVEYLPTLVPLEDDEISKALHSAFRRRGIQCLLGQKVTAVRRTPDGVAVSIEDRQDPSRKQELSAELAMMAVGIAANIEGIGLEQLGVQVEGGFVVIDEVTYRTTAAGIYAVGDMTGPPALAHTASAEGIACVERLAGLSPPPIDYDAVPSGTFCHPEIGSVGLTERAAREQGLRVKVGRFPFRALGKARAAGEMEGFVKVIYAADDGRLLGAHIIGAHASDLIAEYCLAKATEVNAESLIHTMHAHPTLMEALKEATEDAYGHAIHI